MTDKERPEPEEPKTPAPPPFDPDPDLVSELEKGWEAPPFAPDEDLIGDLERGPDPKKPEARRIFRRDPGAEARRLARKREAKQN